MVRRTVRRVLALLCVVVLAACASSESTGDTGDLAAAVDRLTDAPPAAVELTIVEDGATAGAATSVRAKGVMDVAAGSYRLVVDGSPVGLLSQRLPAGRDVAGLEVISQGGDLYLSDGAAGLVPETGFVRIDAEQVPYDGALSVLLGPVVPVPGSTPAFLAETLRHLDSTESTSDEVAGVEGTTVTGQLDLVALFDDLRYEPSAQLVGYYAPGFGATEVAAFRIEGLVEVEAFVDHDGDLRRIIQRFDAGTIAEAEARSLRGVEEPSLERPTTITVEFDDFGGDGSVEIPAGATDVSDRIGGLLDDQVQARFAPPDAAPVLEHDSNYLGPPGTCLSTTDLATRPCEDDHDIEVIALVDLDPGPYPGRSELSYTAGSHCIEELNALPDAPAFVAIASQPTESAWSGGNRQVICTAVPISGGVTGSILAGTTG